MGKIRIILIFFQFRYFMPHRAPFTQDAEHLAEGTTQLASNVKGFVRKSASVRPVSVIRATRTLLLTPESFQVVQDKEGLF